MAAEENDALGIRLSEHVPEGDVITYKLMVAGPFLELDPPGGSYSSPGRRVRRVLPRRSALAVW